MEEISSMIDVEDSTAGVAITSMTPPTSTGPSMKSNKSSLSSSTSSLVSITSTSATPIVFAPPPTPLSSSAAPTPPVLHHQTSLPPLLSPLSPLQTHIGSSSSQQTIPIYQLNQQLQQQHQSSSSYAESLIDGSSSVVYDKLNKYPTPAYVSPPLPPPPHLVTTSTFNTFINGCNGNDDSSSSPSNRRECKSTSDESYTLELEEQSLIASATTKIEKMAAAAAAAAARYNNGDELLYSANNSIYRLTSGGQFGFNPISLGILPTSSIKPTKRVTFAGFARLGKTSGTQFGPNAASRRPVKRLCGGSRFFVDQLKKNNHNDYNHNKKMFFAVSNNDIKSVQEMLDSNTYDVNCQDDKQRTCLHIASSRGHIDLVKLLLENGANPNIRDCVNNLPIHLAIISSHVQVVTVLLEAGTDIQSLDLNGKTVLHLAGTRLRWLLNDENHKASPKLKFEAIMIMNMIKEYLRRKKTSTSDLDSLAHQLENSFNLEDINSLTKQLLNQFDSLNISNNTNNITTTSSNKT